jgi:hypothetical protein
MYSKKNMEKKIFYYINLILFVISFLYILNIITVNYNYFKLSFNKISYIYFSILLVLSGIVNYFGNNINYQISVNFFRNLSYFKFSKVNIISNFINEIIPIFGMMYKGYIFKKFKLSYTNYFFSIFFWRVLNITFFLFFIVFYLLYFKKIFYIKFIIISLIFLFFTIFVYFKFSKFQGNFFDKNKFLHKFQIFFYLLINNLKKIMIYIFLLHLFNFSIFYLLFTSFFSLDLKFIVIVYFLRSLIAFVPLLNITPVTISAVSHISTFLLDDLSFIENLLINFIHSLLLTLGSLLYLFLIFTYEKLKI